MYSTEKSNSEQVTHLFNRIFDHTENTILKGGALEPYYAPGPQHHIYFRADYIRSAFHEVAHWSLAGARRRQLPDYGYWYSPDGRNASQQDAFFMVEAKPQAIEKRFCEAIGIPFSPSVDNAGMNIEPQKLRHFEARIIYWESVFEQTGLPPRANRFVDALRSIGHSLQEPPPEIMA